MSANFKLNYTEDCFFVKRMYNDFMKYFLFISLSYVLGSIPFAYVIGKITKGIDIREVGSKNPGAANVFREVSPIFGVITFILDFAKGFLPPFIASRFGLPIWVIILSGVASVAGHNWSMFLKFKGGGGLSTSLGSAFLLLPKETFIVAVIFLLLFFVGKKGGRGVLPGLTPLVGAGAVSYFIAFVLLLIFREEVYAYMFLLSLLFVQGIRHFKNIVKWLKKRRI